jgi:anti-sigma regulatory factor (Ser/Thr protein kinase)
MTAGIADGGVTVPALHAAAVYDSEDGLRGHVEPFLRAGLDRGDAILAMVPDRVEQVLRAGMDGDSDRVQWRKPALSHRRPGEVFDDFHRFLAERYAAGESARLLTENDLDGDPDRLAAYLRFEAVSTEILRPYGSPWTCLYDRRRHPEQMLACIGEVHPQLTTHRGLPVPSTTYIQANAYLTAHAGPTSPVPEPVNLNIELATTRDLPALRHQLRTRATSTHTSSDEIDLMLVAVTEVVTNALQHGQPPGRVRAWESGRVTYVRVDDHGHAPSLATAGYQRPATPTASGTGFWLARQLADVIHTHTSAAGTVVELQFR